MAHIGGSPGQHQQQLYTGSRANEATKKTPAQTQLEKPVRARGVRTPEQTMAQLTGKLAEAKKMKRMALRKAKRRRRRRKKRRSKGGPA